MDISLTGRPLRGWLPGTLVGVFVMKEGDAGPAGCLGRRVDRIAGRGDVSVGSECVTLPWLGAS